METSCAAVGRSVGLSVDKCQNSALETLQRAVNAVRGFFIGRWEFWFQYEELVFYGIWDPRAKSFLVCFSSSSFHLLLSI